MIFRFLPAFLLLLTVQTSRAERVTVSLNGQWQIEDSVEGNAVPTQWTHMVPVPGLAHLASPEFKDVDLFDSSEEIVNQVKSGRLPKKAIIHSSGISHQQRNYFWYRKTFRVNERKDVAILQVNKAQFGAVVWLNGKRIGEHLPCFTAARFDISQAIRWNGENELIIRIGAHPGVLPYDFPWGQDFEKTKWTPGIYDDVSLLLSDNPVIESVQVAPHIETSEVVVQSVLKNYGSHTAQFPLSAAVFTWKGEQSAGAPSSEQVTLGAGETKTLMQTLRIVNAQLWSPDHPFLYIVKTSTGGDSAVTRFGMREFRFDTATRRAYLNGHVIFLRGSNITLHRFFEDPQSGDLPWNDAWLHRLLVTIPKSMHWNAFRFCIGPVPQKWLDIADENGLLIQNEFFIWEGAPSWFKGLYSRPWNSNELIRQYREWMRDNWNHPSVAIWDANNETLDPVFAAKVIPAVRPLDLSHRPWENSYNESAGPDDPVEDHPYLFQKNQDATTKKNELFRMAQLQGRSDAASPTVTPTAHAEILNEYGWLWLLRDGSPTLLTDRVYSRLLGRKATGEQRFEQYAYLEAGLTEYWRAYRKYAGVLHFVYLTSCFHGAYTCDSFQDVKTLTLEPHFADYMREAFRPLGVYVDFWGPKIPGGTEKRVPVMLVNDKDVAAQGPLAVSLVTADGKEVAHEEAALDVAPLGQHTYVFQLRFPKMKGKFLLKATAYPNGDSPTVSRRMLELTQ